MISNVTKHAAVLLIVMAGSGCTFGETLRPADIEPSVRGDGTVTVPARAPVITRPHGHDVTPGRGPVADAAVLEVQAGRASYYSNALAGRPTANGTPYDPDALIAAHKELPFGSLVRVTNLENDLSVEVRIIDRGPFIAGRIIDLSWRAAETVDMIRAGHVPVRVEVLRYGW